MNKKLSEHLVKLSKVDIQGMLALLNHPLIDPPEREGNPETSDKAGSDRKPVSKDGYTSHKQ